ncbi:MAG: SDR family NAD(P)-dependent oxidoreductase, partial [Chloroflexota bacterium]
MSDFTNRVALVTGGTQGIGYAAAEALLDGGAKVMIGGRNPETGQQAVDALGEKGEVHYTSFDITKPEDVQAIVQATVDAFGKIDYLVNSAGLEGAVANTVECTEENFDA